MTKYQSGRITDIIPRRIIPPPIPITADIEDVTKAAITRDISWANSIQKIT